MRLHPLVLALTLTPLVGCGGSSSSTPESILATASDTKSLSGKAADGYLIGAEVCLDINGNKDCDSDEPSATSTTGGEFTLKGVTQLQIDTYPLLVKVIANETIDTDKPGEVLKAYTLSAPAGYTFVSPLTTMVQNEVEKGRSVVEAEQLLQTKLGTEIALNKDYVEAKTDKTLSDEDKAEFAKLHQIAQITAKVMAANMETLLDTSEEVGIPLDQLITLITDKVFAALVEIKIQVEVADLEVEFDAASIASDIDNNFIKLDADKLEDQITQNQAENSAIVANLIELLTSDGLNWFWGDTDNDGTAELEYGSLKLAGDIVEDQFNEFDFSSGEFVSETAYSTDPVEESADQETWVLSESAGWIQNNELISSITAADNAITLHYSIGDGQFDETITGSKIDLSGLNIALVLNKTDGDGTWAKSIAADATFDDGSFGYKITGTQNIRYRLESLDPWCDDYTGTYTQEQIKSQLGEICNHIQPPSAVPGEAYIQTLAELKTATLLVDWHHLSGNDYSEITAKANDDGSVSFWEDSTPLASGVWSEISAYGQTLIKVTAPASVESMGNHFAHDGTLYFAEFEGFVRQVWAEQFGIDEIIFDASARDTILNRFNAGRLPPLIGSWSNGDISFQFNNDMTYTMEQIIDDGEASDSWAGTESGAFSYDTATGKITVTSITEDNNGTSGLSDYLNNSTNEFVLKSFEANSSLTFSYIDGDEIGEFTLTDNTNTP